MCVCFCIPVHVCVTGWAWAEEDGLTRGKKKEKSKCLSDRVDGWNANREEEIRGPGLGESGWVEMFKCFSITAVPRPINRKNLGLSVLCYCSLSFFRMEN